MKILIATEKPFAAAAVDAMRSVFAEAEYETILLENYKTQTELCAAVAAADGLIVRSDKVSSDVVAAAQALKIVVRAGAGYDNLDLNACTKRGIVAMNTPGQNANAVAELAIGLMLYMLRNAFTCGTGSELRGRILGIHGYGNVGRRVAQLGKAFGMRVLAYDSSSKFDSMFNDEVVPAASAADLYSRSSIVSVHIPANDSTKKSLNAALLGRMQQDGIIINTARKEIVDEDELLALLQKRTDLHYATDIMPTNHTKMADACGIRYFSTQKKMGAETTEANMNAGVAAARQIVNFFRNGDKKFQLNK